MQPFYFGESASPLYGVLHPAMGSRQRDVGVLICNPIGQEYMRSHRALRQCAELMAKSGFPVMRFDYFGTGNSAGQFSESRLSRWLADTKLAIDELIELTGVSGVSLVGLRFGAMIAALVSDHEQVNDVVLWDPIHYGLRYLTSLKVMHLTMLRDLGRFRHPRQPSVDGIFRELLGFPLTRQLELDIESTDISNAPFKNRGCVALFSSFARDDVDELEHKLVQRNLWIYCEKIADAGDWDRVDLMDSALLARAIPAAINVHLARA